MKLPINLGAMVLVAVVILPTMAQGEMYKCGEDFYTNKAAYGCPVLELKATLGEVSSSPSPWWSGRSSFSAPRYTPVPNLGPRREPESPASKAYNEWVQLNDRTQGGHVNQSTQDRQRHVTLQKTFPLGIPPSR